MKLVTCATILLLLSACKAKVSSDLSSNSGQSGGYEGVCSLINNANESIVCLDFPVATAQSQTDCTVTEPGAYSAEGATMGQWMSVTGGGGFSTSCSLMNPGVAVVGSCVLNDRVIRYYANAWSAASAGTDCTQHAGTFEP